MDETIFGLSLTLLGAVLPMLKYPIFMYILYFNDLRDVIYTIPMSVEKLFYVIHRNYLYLHLLTSICLPFLLFGKSSLEWFTLRIIIYNSIMYQTLLLSQFKKYPVFAVLFTSCVQWFDSTPFLYALIDNIATTMSTFPLILLPEKLLIYGVYRLLLLV